MEIGDEQKEAGQDTLIDSPAKIPYCWYNNGDKILRILRCKGAASNRIYQIVIKEIM